jgi:hypothetical protein
LPERSRWAEHGLAARSSVPGGLAGAGRIRATAGAATSGGSAGDAHAATSKVTQRESVRNGDTAARALQNRAAAGDRQF